jgi:hypothetical protein
MHDEQKLENLLRILKKHGVCRYRVVDGGIDIEMWAPNKAQGPSDFPQAPSDPLMPSDEDLLFHSSGIEPVENEPRIQSGE